MFKEFGRFSPSLLGLLKGLAAGKNSARRKRHHLSTSPSNFTKNARLILGQAEEEARQLGHYYVGVGHLLLALTAKAPSIVAQVLAEYEVTPSLIKAAWFPYMENGAGEVKAEFYAFIRLPTVSSDIKLQSDPYYFTVLELANQIAEQLDHPYIGPEHLLLAISQSEIKVTPEITQGETAKILTAKYPFIQDRLFGLLSLPQYQPFAYTNPAYYKNKKGSHSS